LRVSRSFTIPPVLDQVRIRATDQELRNPRQTVIVAVRETHLAC